MWMSLLSFLVPMLKAAAPELQALGLAWLKQYRMKLEAEAPGAIKEIDHAIAQAEGGNLGPLSDLAVRLHERVTRRQAGQSKA